MSVDEIVAQATTFLLAGTDTTWHTLSFALYSLAINPEVQSKLKREIRNCVEQSTVSFSWWISINTPYRRWCMHMYTNVLHVLSASGVGVICSRLLYCCGHDRLRSVD